MTKTVNIVRPFTLNLGTPRINEGETDEAYTARLAKLGPRVVDVAAGIQQVPDEVADHWFTKANSVEGQLDPGEYAASLRSQADAAKIRATEAQAYAEALDAQASEAESEAKAAGDKVADNPDPATKTTPPPENAATTKGRHAAS